LATRKLTLPWSGQKRVLQVTVALPTWAKKEKKKTPVGKAKDAKNQRPCQKGEQALKW